MIAVKDAFLAAIEAENDVLAQANSKQKGEPPQ